MAIISATFDTKEKTLVVTKDGKNIKNVSGVEFFKDFGDDDKFIVEIRTVETDDDNDMTVVTRLIADEDGDISEDITTRLSQALFGRSV